MGIWLISTKGGMEIPSITPEMVNERRDSNTNKTINQNTEVDELGDNYMQRDSIYVHDLWHTTTPGKADSTDLQRRHHGPINSAANDSELDNDYSDANKSTDDALDR